MSNENAAPPPLVDAFGVARTLTSVASGLLLLYAVADVQAFGPLPYFDVTLPDPRQAQLVLAALTAYGAVRSIIEWFQSNPRRRGRTASRADLALTLGMAAVALVVYLGRNFDVCCIGWAWIGKLLGIGLWGFLTGQVLGLAISLTPFVRSDARARRLALPKVPVAVASAYRAVAFWCTITMVGLLLWSAVASSSFVVWLGVFLLPLVVVVAAAVIEVLRPSRALPDGSSQPAKEFVRRIGEVYDLHDTLYRQHGGMPAEGKPPSPLFEACETGNVTEVRDLLDAGRDPDLQEQLGWTPLMIAVAQQHVPVVGVLLEAGANPNIYNTQGRTALMFAARYGNLEVARMLIDAGADPNLTRFAHEAAPLGAAAELGHVPVVEQLLAAGADVNARDIDGRTALDLAQSGGQGVIAAMLRARLREEVAILKSD